MPLPALCFFFRVGAGYPSMSFFLSFLFMKFWEVILCHASVDGWFSLRLAVHCMAPHWAFYPECIFLPCFFCSDPLTSFLPEEVFCALCFFSSSTCRCYPITLMARTVVRVMASGLGM